MLILFLLLTSLVHAKLPIPLPTLLSSGLIFSDNRMPFDKAESFCKLHNARVAHVSVARAAIVASEAWARYNGPSSFWADFEQLVPLESAQQPVFNVYSRHVFAPGTETESMYCYVCCESN